MSRGRPKGYSPYAEITYQELGEWVGRKSLIKVSKSWLEDLIGSNQESLAVATTKTAENPKIEFNLINLNDE